MSMFRTFEDSEREALPEAFARHRQAFRDGEMSVLIILPDGSGFRARPTDDGATVYSQRLTEPEMVAAILSFYGVNVFRVQ